MRFKDFKKRALDALKGRIFTTLLVFFVPQFVILMAAISIMATSYLLIGISKNISLEEQVKKVFIENHLNGTRNQDGLIRGNETIIEKEVLEQRAEKLMYGDKQESNIIKLSQIGDKFKDKHSMAVKVIFIVSLVVLIIFTFLISPGMIKCLLDVGRMEDISFSVLFTNIKTVPKMFLIIVIYTMSTMIGSMLFLIPGIFIEARLYFAPFVLIDDPSKGVIQCLKDSWEISKDAGVIKLYLFRLSFIGWFIVYEALVMVINTKLPLISIVALCLVYIYFYEACVQFYLHYSGQEHTINFANSYAD